MSMRHLPFLEVFEDASGGNIKTPSSEFLQNGKIPVIDQGQSFIAGYVNDPVKICKSKPPVIVFGDHTKAIKYVDFHFAMGADGTKVLEPKNGNHTKYLFYALRALHIPDAGYSRHYKFLKETIIPLPPLAEQKRIAAILDAADALRTKRREALAQLDALLQSTFLTLFGDPVSNPMGWEMATIGSVTDMGTGSTPSRAQEHFYMGNFPWVKSTEVDWGVIKSTSEHVSLAGIKSARLKKYPPGSVVLALYGQGKTRGKCAILGIEATLNQACCALVPSNNCSTSYLFQFLKNSYLRLRGESRGGNQENLNMAIVRQFPIPLPPLPLQQKFAAIVESVERQKTTQRAHLAELDALFAALQHRAFRGEL